MVYIITDWIYSRCFLSLKVTLQNHCFDLQCLNLTGWFCSGAAVPQHLNTSANICLFFHFIPWHNCFSSTASVLLSADAPFPVSAFRYSYVVAVCCKSLLFCSVLTGIHSWSVFSSCTATPLSICRWHVLQWRFQVDLRFGSCLCSHDVFSALRHTRCYNTGSHGQSDV